MACSSSGTGMLFYWNIQLIGLIGQIIYGTVGIIICLMLSKYAFAISLLFLITWCLFLAKTDSKEYQGVLARKKYYKDGTWIVYLARQAILYDMKDTNIYENFEKQLLNGLPENMLKICIETVKHMYMEKCIDKNFGFPNKIQEMIEDEFLLSSLEQFRDMEIGDEKFSLLKVYICNALINSDINARKLAIIYLEALTHEEMNYSMYSFKTFEWYLYFAYNGKCFNNSNQILRPNRFFEKFEAYRIIYKKILDKF